MIESPLFSIIVPVYKVEDYLRQCVDSILEQSFSDYELILVDDGSPDGCPAICDEYAVKDKRVKVIHKENGGLSDARNAGVNAAIGEYLLFIDSDDYIAENSLNNIAECANEYESDMIVLRSIGVMPNGKNVIFSYDFEKASIYKKSKEDVLEYFSNLASYPVSACTKALRREFVIENNLYFSKIKYEDFEHSLGTLVNAKTFNCCESLYYHYRTRREGSIIATRNPENFFDTLYIVEKWLELSETKYIEYSAFLRKMLASEYLLLLWNYNNLPKSEKKEYREQINSYAYFMPLLQGKRARIIGSIYKLFRLGVTAFFVRTYFTLKFRLQNIV